MNKNIQKEIISHCRSKFESISKDYLKKNGIRNSLFIEIMYDTCLKNFYNKGDFTISEEDFQNIFIQAKGMVVLIQDYIMDKCDLVSISEDDHLFFKIRKTIGNNNKENNNE